MEPGFLLASPLLLSVVESYVLSSIEDKFITAFTLCGHCLCIVMAVVCSWLLCVGMAVGVVGCGRREKRGD
jgi:hypothetical protein